MVMNAMKFHQTRIPKEEINIRNNFGSHQAYGRGPEGEKMGSGRADNKKNAKSNVLKF